MGLIGFKAFTPKVLNPKPQQLGQGNRMKIRCSNRAYVLPQLRFHPRRAEGGGVGLGFRV